MKKYIFLSLLIHFGIAVALISWSGASLSKWTQNLFNSFNTDQTIEPIEEQLKEDPPQKTVIKKKKNINKIAVQKIKKKKPPAKKPQLKPVVRKTTPTPTENVSAEQDTAENSNTENTSEEMVQANPPETPPTADSTDHSEINQNEEPEVKYNPAEDLTAIEQEISDPLETSESLTVQEESASNTETLAEEDSELAVQRDFEEINTDPQDLKKMIKEESPKEVKKQSSLGSSTWKPCLGLSKASPEK